MLISHTASRWPIIYGFSWKNHWLYWFRVTIYFLRMMTQQVRVPSQHALLDEFHYSIAT